ncbi:restriction endonuclease subunit S [Campylobacter upsaliensis]|uniref:restriction endonuclease subunit S n=4 Tax=Campylobacter upsaliensis TaxID=28080 RepID=UPI0022EAD45A|nr:restriction endonuclease subunit S [Campylobacter upsaliensis]
MAEIFTRKFSEVSGGRFDAEFYRQEYMDLEEKIKSKSHLKLMDFIISISSGATPDKKEAWKYYTDDKESGIPFLRVQNIKPDTTISNDFIYITKETHENMLNRSQVFENDLIITITGRLGTAAVAPKGFIGNINQHSVVIKTKNLQTSQALATFLNTSIGEKLSIRRATGGTRPALDYKALKSIPIIYNETIYHIIEKANQLALQKENKAKELLDSIDSYLLEELGIILPLRANNTLDSRIYTQKISALSGSRFDANYHQKYYRDLEKSLLSSPYPLVNLASLINNFKKGIEVGSGEYSQNKEIPFIRVSDITNNGIDFDNVQKFISASLFENLKAYKPKENELLYSKDGTIGICLKADVSRDYVISGGILRLELKAEVDKDFLCFLLGSYMMNVFANRISIGAVIKHLNIGEFLNLKIPLPPLAIQTQIASRLKNSKFQALSLEKEAKEILHKAKIDIETLLLSAGGGGVTLAFSFEAFISTQMHYFDKMAKIWNEKEYSVVRLGEILSFVASGSTPESKGEDYEKNGIYHFLRLVDFNDGLEIDFNNALFVKEYIYKNTLSRVQLKNNDILFGIAGSVGKVAQYKSDKMAVVNQAIAILRFQKGAFADFMCYLLASNVIQNQVQRLKRPVAQPNISIMELKGIKIPLPPLTEQERIAKEISQRKARAKALKQEAKELLESAKKEVEHIILGG